MRSHSHLTGPAAGSRSPTSPMSRCPTISRTRRTIDAAASKQGITLQHAVTVTQLATVMSFVRAGLGVAIVPAGAIAGFNTDGLKTLPIIGPMLSRNLELIHAQGTRVNPLPIIQRRSSGSLSDAVRRTSGQVRRVRDGSILSSPLTALLLDGRSDLSAHLAHFESLAHLVDQVSRDRDGRRRGGRRRVADMERPFRPPDSEVVHQGAIAQHDLGARTPAG